MIIRKRNGSEAEFKKSNIVNAILENSKLKFNPGNVTIFIYFSSSSFGFITDTTFFDSTKSSFKTFSTYSLLILENSSK